MRASCPCGLKKNTRTLDEPSSQHALLVEAEGVQNPPQVTLRADEVLLLQELLDLSELTPQDMFTRLGGVNSHEKHWSVG